MYTLHYAPDNASLIIRLVLDTAGIAYQTTLVDRAVRAQDSAAYRRLNPAGLIPTLETPHGAISETGAILLWLGDTHHLAPPSDHPTHLPFLQWLFFLANTVHADLRQLFYPQLYVPTDATPGHHALLSARMIRHFTLLDSAAADHPGLFTAQGLLLPYTAALMRWSALYPANAPRWFSLSTYPTLAVLLAHLDATPAARTVAMAEGLGPLPFSAPILPRPPEGTAL